MNFGLLLTSTINDKNSIDSKRNFLKKLDKYKEEKIKENDELIEKKNSYNLNYQKKREYNDELYINYLQTYINYKENWLKSNKEIDLEKLKNLKKPNIIDVDDIFTYMLIKNKKFKN
jgi:hypothetical protein